MTLGQMMRVSIAMPMLLGLSVLVVAQALERCYVYWSQRLPTRLWDRVLDRLHRGDVQGAAGLCRLESARSSRLERLLTLPDPDTEKLVEAFQFIDSVLASTSRAGWGFSAPAASSPSDRPHGHRARHHASVP